MSGNFAIKEGGGRTPNGKCHLKFPFWLFDSFPESKIRRLLYNETLSIKWNKSKLNLTSKYLGHEFFLYIYCPFPPQKLLEILNPEYR